MKHPHGRTIFKALLLLAAGAALNGAVAWGSVYFVDMESSQGKWASDRGWVAYRLDATASERLHLSYNNLQNTSHPPENVEFGDAVGGWAKIAFLDADSEKNGLIWCNGQAAGFPMLSIWGMEHTLSRSSSNAPEQRLHWALEDSPPGSVDRHLLPLQPIWPGFAINTLFYAGVLWVLFAAPFALRRMIRKRRGRCPHCAYPIGTSNVCTECGAAVNGAPGG